VIHNLTVALLPPDNCNALCNNIRYFLFIAYGWLKFYVKQRFNVCIFGMVVLLVKNVSQAQWCHTVRWAGVIRCGDKISDNAGGDNVR